MKTWYCVVSTFDNSGRVTAAITDTRRAESQPESSYTSTTKKDIYTDWFGSLKEAQRHVEGAKLA